MLSCTITSAQALLRSAALVIDLTCFELSSTVDAKVQRNHPLTYYCSLYSKESHIPLAFLSRLIITTTTTTTNINTNTTAGIVHPNILTQHSENQGEGNEDVGSACR